MEWNTKAIRACSVMWIKRGTIVEEFIMTAFIVATLVVNIAVFVYNIKH